MGYQNIIQNEKFLKRLLRLEQLEDQRQFCRHNLPHLLDVCRIAYIAALEERLDITKDLIYGAGLLHDIGRVDQYLYGVPHEEASVSAAAPILEESGYSKPDIQRICDAIGAHRTGLGEDMLAELLYRADKQSRCCFCCAAADECNWPKEKKNKGIEA